MNNYRKVIKDGKGVKLHITPKEESRFLAACIDKNLSFNRVAYEKFKENSGKFPYRFIYDGLISYGETYKVYCKSKQQEITLEEFEAVEGFDYSKDRPEIIKESCIYCDCDVTTKNHTSLKEKIYNVCIEHKVMYSTYKSIIDELND